MKKKQYLCTQNRITMSVTLNKKPAGVCFTADGVSYLVIDSNPTSNAPRTFRFKLSVESDSAPENEYITVDLVCYPEKGEQGENRFNIDLTDIILAHTGRYHIFSYGDAEIFGYATVQLTHIDGVASALDSTEHFCLPGTSGGLTLTGVMPSNKHPFLLARGEEEGALHFYRSELEAMEAIFAYVSNEYHEYSIDTDSEEADQADYTEKMIIIPNCYNLFGIWLDGNSSSPFKIYAETNILMLYYHWYDEFLINSISIQDEPDTDESYLIRWTNSMGAREALLLTGELQDISEVENQDPYITSQSVNLTRRSYKRRTVTTKYSLQTGYLSPARIIALKDMLTSDSVDIKIDGEWVPVLITTDTKHAVHQREPETFELTIEVLKQTRFQKPNRTVYPLPSTRDGLLQDNSGNFILDNNSNTIQENEV